MFPPYRSVSTALAISFRWLSFRLWMYPSKGTLMMNSCRDTALYSRISIATLWCAVRWVVHFPLLILTNSVCGCLYFNKVGWGGTQTLAQLQLMDRMMRSSLYRPVSANTFLGQSSALGNRQMWRTVHTHQSSCIDQQRARIYVRATGGKSYPARSDRNSLSGGEQVDKQDCRHPEKFSACTPVKGSSAYVYRTILLADSWMARNLLNFQYSVPFFLFYVGVFIVLHGGDANQTAMERRQVSFLFFCPAFSCWSWSLTTLHQVNVHLYSIPTDPTQCK